MIHEWIHHQIHVHVGCEGYAFGELTTLAINTSVGGVVKEGKGRCSAVCGNPHTNSDLLAILASESNLQRPLTIVTNVGC